MTSWEGIGISGSPRLIYLSAVSVWTARLVKGLSSAMICCPISQIHRASTCSFFVLVTSNENPQGSPSSECAMPTKEESEWTT